jgi:transcriptional regulator with XRE-family HTH domain
MTHRAALQRISRDELAERWFAFQHELLTQLQGAARAAAARGLTQENIADRLGKDPAFVSRCLRGQQNMTTRTMHDLARAMDCRLDIRLEPLDDNGRRGVTRARSRPSTAAAS